MVVALWMENPDKFMTGNMNKITPVTAFEDTSYQAGPVTSRVRDLYWDWALSA